MSNLELSTFLRTDSSTGTEGLASYLDELDCGETANEEQVEVWFGIVCASRNGDGYRELWSDAQTAGRFLGTVTAVNGNTLTVKTDAGVVQEVEVPSTASLKQVEPGAKT